jgi:anti-anti-sigma factor
MVMADTGEAAKTTKDARRGRLWGLSMAQRRAENEAILLLVGRLGHTTVPELEAAARQLIADGVSNLVLDLSRVDYLSSAALGVIERLAGDLAGKGGRLTLRDPAVPVRVTLELSGDLVRHIESKAD